VTANDYGVRLFNGDIGFVLRDEEDGELRAFFPAPAGGVRKISLARLPDHETAFAMTVHKSQGSEFTRVALLLPPRDSPVLTRELVYTGITRAGRFLHLWTTPEILRAAVRRRTQRVSGLGDLLRP
jgi:exodeoxyribonuclease V alpha subunit